ncbi:MAG: ABC transporter ATP-binding protein [Candidatus Cloacimonetes bacterium]|nr:ABC transporter ATP-binding protein [Candidatus Cloacimonadota bacterium]
MLIKITLINTLMKGKRIHYLGAIIAIALATMFSFITPLIIRYTIDVIIGKNKGSSDFVTQLLIAKFDSDNLAINLWLIGITLTLITIFQGLFIFLNGKWSALASENLAKNIREKLYSHLQKLPFSYHTQIETGDVIQRCTSDVETIRAFFGLQLIEVGRALLMLGLVIPIMLTLNKDMTIISMSIIPLIFAFSLLFFIKIRKAFQISDETEGELTTVLQENLSGIRVVRAFNNQNYESDKFDKKNRKYADKTYRLIQLLATYWSFSDFLCMLQMAAILVIGSFKAVHGIITIGTLVVFLTYERMLLWPVRQLGKVLTDMGKTTVSLQRILEILNVEIEKYDEEFDKTSEIRGDIKFENVTFSYGNGPVLKSISFDIKAGETLAIIGPTGSGKSSLVNLIPRLYDYSSGSIKIDGKELNCIGRKTMRRNVGIVSQEPFLFSRTIMQNFLMGKKNALEDEIYSSAQFASADEFIKKFESGYETRVGEKGVTLSGGQKQRIAIGRTILKKPPILIFDDSLSAVDAETDARIRNSLLKIKGKHTTIIVSHRINSVAHADKILVLENGRITQQGKHKELINEVGLYRRIWSIQSSLEEDIKHEMDFDIIENLEESKQFKTNRIKYTER